MSEPQTVLDGRFSDPTGIAVEWEATQRALSSAQLFWLTTVRADDRPHVTPVVAAWVDDALWFATGDNEQKFVNLRTNPHVVLTTGCNDWDRGLDVVLEGEAVQVTDDGLLRRVAQAFTSKWDGRWQPVARDGAFYEMGGDGGAKVFSVSPVKVFAHAKGDPFGMTRHLFP